MLALLIEKLLLKTLKEQIMNSVNNKTCFAEVLQTTIDTWQGQCWQWDIMPEFGALITVPCQDRIMFGIIYAITTSPIDAIRQPVAYQKTQEELAKEQPQIFEFLTTSFSCLALGYQEKNKIFYNLPPQPPKIHSFVHHATDQQYADFFSHEQFLYLLFNSKIPLNIQELLLAVIQHQLKRKCMTKNRLSSFVEAFFMLNKNNYLQTKMFLSRLEQLVSNYDVV